MIPKTFDPAQVEAKWYDEWQSKGFFHSEPDERESFTIVIPPPNVTGVLHMGHALNNTVQDILARKARMEGKNTCWVPGTDHASIATEAKVVAMLKERGIDKSSLSREEFLKYAWEWKEKYGGIILQQLKKLGASCDWERTTFTMDDHYYRSVIRVFVDLYKKGLIYKGTQMVNWDPQARTAVSDEEVNFKEVRSKLYYIRYPISNSDDFVIIATTRPETMLGDTAICVHPADPRFEKLHGQTAIVPLINRTIPVILDTYADMEFGTGALKVTPAHDKNDYELGKVHNLDFVDIFTEEGKLNDKAQIFVGDDRFIARKKILKELEEKGFLIKVEEIQNNVGYSERTDAIIEPRISQQWFCRMYELARPAIDSVMGDDIEFYPAKFKNVYRHWMDNIRDWCISRQLWWGHRIPVWYLPDGSFVVAEDLEGAYVEAVKIDEKISIQDLKQDEDVMDTWFSSWLWPIAVFNGILEPDNKEINYYYPTQVLVTAPEIIFFWVARMIMSGYEYRGKEPFEEVYFTGIVRDKLGRKMSKSLGNSPDLLELIDKYSADGVRFGIMVTSPAGNDLLFDEKLCEQGRNFSNKVWNAMRLVKGWEEHGQVNNSNSAYAENAVEWFANRMKQVMHDVEDYFEEFRLSEALTLVYKLIWDDFCSSYLEMIKPAQGENIHKDTFDKTITFFEELVKILHPFMPFITEEIWHHLKEREPAELCVVANYPKYSKPDAAILRDSNKVLELISNIRGFRNETGLSPKAELELFIRTNHQSLYIEWQPIISKLANISKIEYVDDHVEASKSFSIKTDIFYIPQEGLIDVEQERIRLKSELEYTQGFLKAVNAKLANERFVQNANPDIVEKERQKKEDAEAKIRQLEESLRGV